MIDDMIQNPMVAPWLGIDIVAENFSEFYIPSFDYPLAASVAEYILEAFPYLNDSPIVGDILGRLSQQITAEVYLSTDKPLLP